MSSNDAMSTGEGILSMVVVGYFSGLNRPPTIRYFAVKRPLGIIFHRGNEEGAEQGSRLGHAGRKPAVAIPLSTGLF